MAISGAQKLDTLRESLAGMPFALVAFSGGVDSAFLLAVAREVLGDRCTALIARSASIPGEELATARAVAASLGATLIEVDSQELSDPRYAANPSNRCFYCKTELFRIAVDVAERLRRDPGADGGASPRDVVILDGTNLDDASDHRPGREAARAAGVRSPLLEAQLSKDEIRHLSRARGLVTWDKPSAPCLSSRIPQGIEVTAERLEKIAAAERAVRALGFKNFRVRFHESVARLEIEASELPRAFEHDVREALSRGVKAAGFAFVALDLEGFRSGRLNVLAGDPPRS